MPEWLLPMVRSGGVLIVVISLAVSLDVFVSPPPETVAEFVIELDALLADGHTVFVSSHLMSEMAQTATRLVVIGRGRLIADTTVAEFVARASNHSVTVRTPEAARLRELLLGPDITVTTLSLAAKPR